MNDATKRWILLATAFAVPLALVATWATSAGARLADSRGAAHEVATASVANDAYCTAELKAIVRRVAGACGLLEGGGGGRGCQPMKARKVAALSGNDFNAMFRPLLFECLRVPAPDPYRTPPGVDRPQALEHYVAQLEQILRQEHERIAAMVIEPLVQAAAGMIVHPPGYLRAVRELIEQALRRHHGKISRAAEELGVSRPTFYELMEKFGISRAEPEAG